MPIKLITGSEKVETWSDEIWRTILGGIRIVVSTPQVLYDGLAHAFIKLSRLALLVFDEGELNRSFFVFLSLLMAVLEQHADSSVQLITVLGKTQAAKSC